jgi:foldase protein PrsA
MENTTKGMSTGTIVVLIALVTLAALAYIYRGTFIAATVNGTPISRFAVVQELERVSGEDALNSLITEELINQEAQAKGVVITDEEITTQLASIEEQLTAQGSTLEQALSMQGITRDDLIKQLTLQKKIEKLLGDQVQVTDEEVAAYITENDIEVPEGQEESYTTQVRELLRQQEFNTAAGTLVETLRTQASIKYLKQY